MPDNFDDFDTQQQSDELPEDEQPDDDEPITYDPALDCEFGGDGPDD